MATTYTYSSSFSVAGAGVNGATVNAYKASRFSGVPALDAAAPGSADATTTTGTANGFNGAFAIALPTAEDYYISVSYLGHTYWTGPVSQMYADGTGALGNTAAAGTLPGFKAGSDLTGTIDNPTLAASVNDSNDHGGLAGAASIVAGVPAAIGGATRNGVCDMVIGDSFAVGLGGAPGVTDWATRLAIMENRLAGLPDPGGFVLGNAWGDLSSGAVVAAITVASVTLGATTTVTASAFNGVVPGQTVTVSSGTGTLAAGTYVVSVHLGNCVLNQAPLTNGTATLSFSPTMTAGFNVPASAVGFPTPTSWNISSAQAMGDGVTKTGGTVTVASVTTTSTSTSATVVSGGFPGAAPGMYVTGTGIPPGARVQSISSNTITFTMAATASGTVTLTFFRQFRRAQVYYAKQNNGDNVTFTIVGGVGSASASISTHSETGGVGVWDSGDQGYLGSSGGVPTGGGIYAAGGAHSAGAGGAGVIIYGVRYWNSSFDGTQIDTFGFGGTLAATWAQPYDGASTYYTSWAAAAQAMAQAGTPYRRCYVMCGINDAAVYAGPANIAASYATIATICNTVSPTTEVIFLACWYASEIPSYANVVTISGSNLISSVNFNQGAIITLTPHLNAIMVGAGIPNGAQVTNVQGTNNAGSAWTVASVTTNGTTTATVASGGFPNVVIGMIVSGTNISAATYVSNVVGNTLTLSQVASGSGTQTLTFTPVVTLSLNCTATATITAYETQQRQGAANWKATASALKTQAFTSGAGFVSLYDMMGDLSATSQVTSVTTTTGSNQITVASGGWPGVYVGNFAYNANLANESIVESIVGNTITLSGNATATGSGNQTVVFSNDRYGLTNGTYLHLGDSTTSISGRDGQRAIAEGIASKLRTSRNLPASLNTFATSDPNDGAVVVSLPYNAAGAGTAIAGYNVATDAVPSWQLSTGFLSSARLSLGVGGTTALDTFLLRTSAGVVRVNSAIMVGGLTGATTLTRYVGGTAGGAPTSGTFAVGDMVPTTTGQILMCTVLGTPGTWNRANQHLVQQSGPGATPTINVDTTDIADLIALAAAITGITISGTPVNGQQLLINFTDNGTARAITFGASFEASTVALPTTTVISTKLTTCFQYSTQNNKFRLMWKA